MGPPIMVLSPQASSGLATGQVSSRIGGRVQSCIPACSVKCSSNSDSLHARSVTTRRSDAELSQARVSRSRLQCSNPCLRLTYEGPLPLPSRYSKSPLNTCTARKLGTSFGLEGRRGKRFLTRSSLEDPAELAEAAHQTGEQFASVVEGGAEGIANSGKAIAGAAAAAGVLAGQIGKVVGKTTSLVRDAYGPDVEDQISNYQHDDPVNVLEQIEGAVGLAKGDVDLEGFREKLADVIDEVSDEVKLAASQAGLAAVAAAGAALNRDEKETPKAYACAVVEEPKKWAVGSATAGSSKAPTKQQAEPSETGLPAGEDKNARKIEGLVASQLKLEVSEAGPVLDAERGVDKEGAAVVVVDALKERLADFAGGVEEEIKRKQAERDAEKQRERDSEEKSREHEERHRDQKPIVRGGHSVGENGGGRPNRGGLQRQIGATKVRVGRERHIPVNKADLIPAMRDLFEDERDAAGFVAVCTSVESILHAEHQVIMEELRADYALTHTEESDDDADVSNQAGTLAAGSSARRGSESDDDRKSLAAKSGTLSEDESTEAGLGKVSSKILQKLLGSREKKRAARKAIGKVKKAVSGDEDGSSDESGGNGAGRVGKIVLSEPGRGSLVQSKFSDVADEGKARRSVRDDASERFETNVLEILSRGQFEALTSADLELTAALNEDYLLTLPINVDWKSSSKEAIIFRRGYSVERESGRMTGPKTDYLQSVFLQSLFQGAVRPLYEVGTKIRKTYQAVSNDKNIRPVLRKVERWLGEPLPVEGEGEGEGEIAGPAVTEARNGPVTVPRYEAFLSSAGSRGLLIKKLLISLGLVPEERDKLADLAEEIARREAELSPRYVSRVSMQDVFRPSLENVSGGSLWDRVKASAGVMFAQTTLLEPAYREMVILYTPKPSDSKPTLWQRWVRRPKNALQRRFRREVAEGGSDDGQDEGGEVGDEGKLQLNMYKDIPIPELKVVFPDKKLSYRLLDTVRLDLTTILGILAFGLQYRFDDLNSISNFILDAIAFASLSYFLFRTSLSYARTFDRYRLLVNKTLYEKTLASGFGVIHFIVDASEDQQFKEAALAYGLLLKADTWQTQQGLARDCVAFLEQRCGAQILMPVDRALETLIRLGLAESTTKGDLKRAVSSGRSPETADDGLGASRQTPNGSSISEEAEREAGRDAETLQFDQGLSFGEEREGEKRKAEVETENLQMNGTGSEKNGVSTVAEAERGSKSRTEERTRTPGQAASAESVQVDRNARAESSDGLANARSRGLEAQADSDGRTERTESLDGRAERTEEGTAERSGKDGELVYRAIRTGEAMPGLERRWLGLLMRPSVWALNKETH